MEGRGRFPRLEFFCEELLNRVFDDGSRIIGLDNCGPRLGKALNDCCSSNQRAMILNHEYHMEMIHERNLQNELKTREKETAVAANIAAGKTGAKCINFIFCQNVMTYPITASSNEGWVKCTKNFCRQYHCGEMACSHRLTQHSLNDIHNCGKAHK